MDVCRVKPSDLVYSAPNLKTLGLSLHKVGRDCLLLDKQQDNIDCSDVFKELKICLSACQKLVEKHHKASQLDDPRIAQKESLSLLQKRGN